jgi:hypothetical protein
MTKWFATAAFAAVLTLGAAHAALAEMRKGPSPTMAGVSAHRHYRHHDRHDAYRPYYSHYYGRPTYYSPGPFFPLPPFFGYGWDLW